MHHGQNNDETYGNTRTRNPFNRRGQISGKGDGGERRWRRETDGD